MIFNAYAEQTQSAAGISIVSCGHIFAKSGREIYRPHGRDDWLLFYIAKENETFYLRDTVTAGAGSFVIFAPGECQHHLYEGSKTAEFYYVHFKCEDGVVLDTSRVYELPFDRRICDIFEELLEETVQKAPQYQKLCAYKLLELLTLLEREVGHNAHPQKESYDRIAAVIAHMNRFYASELTLCDYAAMCSMSKYHFLRVFGQIVGTTPLDYRNNIRLEHAAELLTDKRLSVEEIGRQTGFASASYFSSAFKKKFGLSPKQYRTERTR